MRMENETNRTQDRNGKCDTRKAAIVTGASSGIGKAITEMLLQQGYEVFGFGRQFEHAIDSIANVASERNFTSAYKEGPESNFHPIVCDITKIGPFTERINDIKKHHNIHLLVNNAGVGYFGPHEELNPAKIHAMVTTNLEIPMVLSQLLLRDLKKHKGTIINISSITAKKSNAHGCAYGATKAGLSSFSTSLFDEVRKYGVRVITIHPDMTKSAFYRNANFHEGDSLDSYLLPEEVAEACRIAINNRDGLVMTDITLQPQIHRLGKEVSH